MFASIFGFPVNDWISHYGYWAVVTLVGLENAGLPLPGEIVLVTAALVAGTSHDLSIGLVIASAAGGGILGATIGYLIGFRFGFPLLVHHGRRIGMGERQIKLGQYLFLRHGGKLVFFGRLLAVLRILAALLAGINRMPLWRFQLANLGGGILWAGLYGGGGYVLGRQIDRVGGMVSVVSLIIGVIIFLIGLSYLHHHQKSLEEQALKALPGSLEEELNKKS